MTSVSAVCGSGPQTREQALGLVQAQVREVLMQEALVRALVQALVQVLVQEALVQAFLIPMRFSPPSCRLQVGSHWMV